MMIANDPQLIFILGMDVDKVAAGIAVKHKQIIPYLQFDPNHKVSRGLSMKGIEYAYTFIEKFVQIRFQIPQPTKSDFERFLKIISPRTTQKQRILTSRQNTQQPLEETEWEIPTSDEIPTPAEERSQRIEYIKLKTGEDSEIVRNIALMVASALDYNPRRWKQFINLFRLMLKAVGREKGEWIREELVNFPCTDLRTIDQLWVKYSNGQFGFSVQKKIYLSVGGVADGNYDKEALTEFGVRVGWKVNDSWISYFSYTFSTEAPFGHLPTVDWVAPSLLGDLFSRIQTCKL